MQRDAVCLAQCPPASPPPPPKCWSRQTPAWTRGVHLDGGGGVASWVVSPEHTLGHPCAPVHRAAGGCRGGWAEGGGRGGEPLPDSVSLHLRSARSAQSQHTEKALRGPQLPGARGGGGGGMGTCDIWNGETWCGERLAPILKYHCKFLVESPRIVAQEHAQTADGGCCLLLGFGGLLGWRPCKACVMDRVGC